MEYKRWKVPSSVLCYKPKEFLQRNKSYLAHEGQTDKSNESWLIANQKFLANPFIVPIIILIIMLPSWGLGQHCVPTPKMAYFSVFKAFLFLKYF